MEQELTTSNNKRKMTIGQASAVITGCGVGGGVLALPYLINKIGFPLAVVIIILAYLFCSLLNTFFADLAIRNGGKGQTIEIIRNVVFSEKFKKIGSIILFIFLALQIIFTLGAYINGAGDILTSLFRLSKDYSGVGKLVFFVFAAAVSFAGLKILGIVEQGSVIIMYGMLIALVVGSCLNIKSSLPTEIQRTSDVFAFFGMAMLALNSFYSVPQVVDGLDCDVKKIKQSIWMGGAMNILIVIIIAIFSLLSSKEVTKMVIDGWSAGIGEWAKVIGSIFTLLAFFTSYWSLSYALRDMIKQMFKLNTHVSLALANFPSLVIALVPIGNFSIYLDLSSAFVGLCIALFIIPGFYKQKKINNGETYVGILGSTPIIIFVLLGYFLMVAGSIVAIVCK